MSFSTGYLTDSITFGEFAFERVISVLKNEDELSDVEFIFFGQPSPLTCYCPDDIHIYFNHHDLTGHTIKALKRRIDQSDQKLFLSQYKECLDKWLYFEEALGGTLPSLDPSFDLTKEREAVETLLNTNPLSDNLKQLGDLNIGWRGTLHLFNFLYNQINLQPLSLKEIISSYNEVMDNKISFPPSGPWRLTFSSGTCRLYSSSDWNPLTKIHVGSINYRMEFIFSGHKIEKILDQVSKLVGEIYRKLSLGGEVYDDVNGSKETLQKVLDILNNWDNLIGNAKDITSVKNTLEEIRNLLRA